MRKSTPVHKNVLAGLLATGLLLVGQAAQALVLTPDDCSLNGGSVTCWYLPNNSQPNADSIETLVGSSADLDELYKANVGGGEEGAAATWYETTFSNPSNDPEDALIEWVASGLDKIIGDEIYLLVKDGKHNPPGYVFDISLLWDGEEAIQLDGFWPAQGAISNVTIFASDGGGSPPQGVPEPGIAALLGFGLIGISVVGRNRKQRKE